MESLRCSYTILDIVWLLVSYFRHRKKHTHPDEPLLDKSFCEDIADEKEIKKEDTEEE